MNLDQIATKCFILALFIRDDGERLLLGDGFYDFKSNLQHFQANTIANDIVELQGDNGQLLAGQVMRSGAQKFEGYIGDATTNRQTIEQKRSDFMAFFRIKHFYQVIYILPDGTAIQRRRGYLTDAPAVPEIFQKFPEYSVALNFEDANYYEYAEDEHGDEIYAHIAELALAGGATGGLIWDAIGAVSNGISWSGIQTAQGEYIQVTNALDIPAKLASVEMLGKAEQTTYSGKNLFSGDFAQFDNQGGSGSTYAYFQLPTDGVYTLSLISKNAVQGSNPTFLGFTITGGNTTTPVRWAWRNANSATGAGQVFSTTNQYDGQNLQYVSIYTANANTLQWFMNNFEIQLEAGNTRTDYEPYVGGTASPNPDYPQAISVVTGENVVKIEGKNLFKPYQTSGSITANGVSFTMNADGSITLNGNSTGNTWLEIVSDFRNGTTATTTPVLRLDPTATYTTSIRVNSGTFTGTPSVHIQKNATTEHGYYLNTTNTMTDADGLYRAWFRITSADTFSNATIQIQLELGSTATDYEPYQGQEFPIDLGSIELAKIGNYQDRIYKTGSKWYIEKQVGKVVLDGTEAWGYNSAGNVFVVSDSVDYMRTGFVPMSDYYTGQEITSYSQLQDMHIGFLASSSNSTVVKNTNYTTANDFKTWLQSHNTIVYYALATPTTTEITNEALIAQLDALKSANLYLGVNNIGTETQNAVPTLKIEYYTEVDLDGAGYEWEPGGNTAKTIVTVAGVDSAWPIWTVQGGAQNPTLTNITTGQTISWQGFVPEGQTLTINMAEMTADLAGANVFEYITGEWIRLAPGNNTLVYTAGSADKPSTLSWNGVLA